ncbi:MAG: hypothetical protein RI924_1326 [Bacteroidota bacterium]|jgi:ribosomal protein S28E/S33
MPVLKLVVQILQNVSKAVEIVQISVRFALDSHQEDRLLQRNSVSCAPACARHVLMPVNDMLPSTSIVNNAQRLAEHVQAFAGNEKSPSKLKG